MKHVLNIFAFLLLAVLVSSCGKDNYEPPKSTLTGQVMYKDASGNEYPLYVRGTSEAVRFRLYQYGWELKDGIDVFLNQDGKFESLLFDGEYHLVPNKDNGPWKSIYSTAEKKDTVDINLKGSANLKVYVTPYFLIRNDQVSVNGYTVNADFDVDKIIDDARVDRIDVFLSTTNFVDEGTNFIRRELSDKTPGHKTFSFTIDNEGEKNNLDLAKNRTGKIFGRIGVKAAGADQFIYSKVTEIALK